MKVLVAVDSSATGGMVASRVAKRPWPGQTSFEVLSVANSPVPGDELTARMTTIAEGAAREICSHRLNATAFVVYGHPKAAIVDRAKEIGADLVMIGADHGEGIGHLLLGGVASAVIRHAHCSVEVVRPGTDSAGGMKILLATDGSGNSLAAAQAIAKRPWPVSTEVRILTVVELSLTMLESTLEPPYLNRDMIETQRAQAMKRAESAIRDAEEILTAAGLKTSESISVLIENPRDIILKEASEWGADLIFVGCHGRRALDRFLLGSVSEGVALHAHVSVEVVRSAGQRP